MPSEDASSTLRHMHAPYPHYLQQQADNEVVFHNPNHAGSGAYRREPIAHFKKAFESIQSPALARYSLES